MQSCFTNIVWLLYFLCITFSGYLSGKGCTNLVAGFSSFTRQTREIIITDAVRRIRRDGYPVEKHNVQTKDGYILTLHRIPYLHPIQKTVLRRPVVFLLAGIYASSDAWLLNGQENSLPYLLSKSGFDVWLGNNRGNIYCRRNIWYNTTDREFWDFSWHEMSVYDMPATIEYIIKKTGEPKMHFVGISQGGTVFLVLNSMLPQYNAVFKTATLLAPVAYVSNTKGSLAKVFGPILGTRNYISKLLEGVEMVSTNKIVKQFLSMACLENERPSVCVSRLWPAVGYDTEHLNKTLLPDIMANFPVGGSFKQIMHYFQGYVSTKFRQYDYGPEKNWLMYQQLEPPEYCMELVTVPITIYYAENDYIVSVEDIWKLMLRLRSLHAIYKLPWKRWNHFDFICGLGVREFIFDKIVKSLITYEYN
ncbi:lipase 3-like [Teleopsis dalmanni]|uniref:lipase 3-like n=1 Tax=Teleopsis dalmanni TaxID=139649 RepID=UPI0018CDBA5B|nr:lipase 3-like [Teleopsis dalmanni]XP_037954597.1 lipase 3-like [Teleopsis dalmanni]